MQQSECSLPDMSEAQAQRAAFDEAHTNGKAPAMLGRCACHQLGPCHRQHTEPESRTMYTAVF